MGLVALALAPSLLWLWYFWRQDRSTREGAGPMARAFLWGTLSVIPALILELAFGTPGQGASLAECFFVIGPAEELCKFLATLRAIRNEPDFDEPSDGIVAAAAVALGFAFAENLGYFSNATGSLVMIRSLLSVPGHVLFAVFYGAAIGRQRCLAGISHMVMARGLLMASVVHGLFDAILFHATVNPLLFLVLFVVLVWFQWRMYKRLAAACAAEGRELRARATGVEFVDQPILDQAITGQPITGQPSLEQPSLEQPGVVVEAPVAPGFQWKSAFSAVGWALLFFFVTAAGWAAVVPASQQNARSTQLGVACIVAMILGGLVSAYRSPGRTVRESAFGLGAMGLCFGAAEPVAGAAFALVLAFLGAFGGWLGEALQDAREGRK